MMSVLVTKGVWNAISTEKPSSDSDSMALAFIRLYVEPHLLPRLSAVDTAKEAWELLADMYTSKTVGRRLQLVRELHDLKKMATESIDM